MGAEEVKCTPFFKPKVPLSQYYQGFTKKKYLVYMERRKMYTFLKAKSALKPVFSMVYKEKVFGL